MLNETIEYENDTIRLVKVSGYRLHPNFPRGDGQSAYYKIQGRKIRHVVIHSMAGAFRRGPIAVERLAAFHASSPKYKRDETGAILYDARNKPIKAGGGRGWPGPGYGFVVPYWPEIQDGRLVVYRLWDDDWVTFATGGQNTRTISVACSGMHKTRHMPKWSAGQARDPEQTQFIAMESLVIDYLLPRYNLRPADIRGHFDFTKPACPGDVYEAWIREQRGEAVGWLEPERRVWAPQELDVATPVPETDYRDLDTWEQRQAALVALGYDVGPSGVDGLFGEDTRSAVEAFQAERGLVVDGIWGRITEAHMRRSLAVV